MGMYDDVKFVTACPVCGKTVRDFQSKDNGCLLLELEFGEVNNFYSSCDNCGAWIEYNRKKPRPQSSIDDYEMTFTKGDSDET